MAEKSSKISKSKIDKSNILDMVNHSPMDKVKMMLGGKNSGMQYSSMGNRVGPMLIVFITITVLFAVLISGLIYAKEMSMVREIFSFYKYIVLLYLLIFVVILRFRPWLMSNYVYLIEKIGKDLFGDNDNVAVEEGEMVEVFQPEEIKVNLTKANVAPKVEVGQ